MPYDNYDYTAVYTEDLPEEDEEADPNLKCQYRTKSTQAGEMMEIDIYPSFKNRKSFIRAKKCKPSRKEQRDLNEKNARKHAVRTLSANFTTDDLWGTFGWDNERQPKTEEDAYRQCENWIARVNYHGRKAGLPLLKYWYVIEETEGNPDKGEPPIKYHMHIAMDGLHDRDTLEKLWYGGEYPQTRRLKVKDFGITGMATYISKKVYTDEETQISKNQVGKKRWRQSKGLKQWTRKPSFSYSRFTKAKIKKIVEKLRNAESLKSIFEKVYPGYRYSDEYPCEVKYNELINGYYLYCRMYKNHSDEQRKGGQENSA